MHVCRPSASPSTAGNEGAWKAAEQAALTRRLLRLFLRLALYPLFDRSFESPLGREE
jgi:hypothetical protein